MTSDRSRTLQELGTRLEWAYPAERDPSLLAIIAPLFPWADPETTASRADQQEAAETDGEEVVPPTGLEPVTPALRMRCSTS